MEHCLDGSVLPSQNMGLQDREREGPGWASLLDDGGQLCAKVLAVEPLLKQDIRGASHVVSARTKDGQPSSPSGRPQGSLSWALHMDVWAWLALKNGPCRAGRLLHSLAQPSGHT